MKAYLTPEQVDALSCEDHNLALAELEEWITPLNDEAQFNTIKNIKKGMRTTLTISGGNELVVSYPGIFLLESVDLVQAFVKTLTPSELAVFIDDEQVTEWLYLCKQDDPQPEFEFWDDGDPDDYISTFYSHDEYAEVPVLNEYGQAVQNALNALAECKGVFLRDEIYGEDADYYKAIHKELIK